MLRIQSILLIFMFLVVVGGWNWIDIVSRIGMVVHRFESSPWLTSLRNIDLTGGAIYLSLPPDSKMHRNREITGMLIDTDSKNERNAIVPLRTTDPTETKPTFLTIQTELDRFEDSTTKNLGLVRMHRLGVTALKKVPDSFLIGLMSLIAAELFQRELIRQSLSFPPIVQALANRTVSELDFKLQLLSALQWNVKPFLEYELENLQTQPIEIIDRYIISEIIARIDREFTPFLENYIKDPILTKRIVNQVKNLVEIIAVSLTKNSVAAKDGKDVYDINSRVTLLERIEKALEDVVIEWNKLIEDLTVLLKAENVIQYMKVNLLHSATSSNLTFSSDGMKLNTTALFTFSPSRFQFPSWTRLSFSNATKEIDSQS